ncbi:MAG: 16S rRNA (cytosine(1402)-N(4))-methyltransferase [Candidatus Dojkabacteria bacterium]|nr:16S rRNA (cytosine(1402)-N(4))-methyltransferase [Candidatus Dojkabacteria bacterium]
MKEIRHIPVLLNEVLDIFDAIQKTKPDKHIVLVDCTLGMGGHSSKLYEKLKKGTLVSLDLDLKSIQYCINTYNFDSSSMPISDGKNTFTIWKKIDEEKSWIIVHARFSQIESVLNILGFYGYDLLLADLGFSNFQIKKTQRGLSFDSKGNLSMNLSDSVDNKLRNLLKNKLLIRGVLQRYTDLPDHTIKRVVNNIANYQSELNTNVDLIKAINLPKYIVRKVFVAFRIYSNDEEFELNTLINFISRQKSGVSLIITFSNFESSLVEQGNYRFGIIEPNIKEILENDQARSAKLYKIYSSESE